MAGWDLAGLDPLPNLIVTPIVAQQGQASSPSSSTAAESLQSLEMKAPASERSEPPEIANLFVDVSMARR